MLVAVFVTMMLPGLRSMLLHARVVTTPASHRSRDDHTARIMLGSPLPTAIQMAFLWTLLSAAHAQEKWYGMPFGTKP
jgi:hypothetical protein